MNTEVSEKYFWGLLHKYNELLDFDYRNPKTDEHEEIESELWQKYGCRKAVLAIDMSGFTLITRKYGIIHYLSMIQRMRSIIFSRIRNHGGTVIKFIADNCLAVFPESLPAIRFSMLLSSTFELGNVLAPDELDIYISCGIDFGDILMPSQQDCFGDAVNIASKLGEDVARQGQILITQGAMNMVPESAMIRVDKTQIININSLDIEINTINHIKTD